MKGLHAISLSSKFCTQAFASLRQSETAYTPQRLLLGDLLREAARTCGDRESRERLLREFDLSRLDVDNLSPSLRWSIFLSRVLSSVLLDRSLRLVPPPCSPEGDLLDR